MNLHKIFLAILITGLIGCQSKKTEVNIIGKINGDIPGVVEYTSSENGACFWGFPKSLHADSLGNFNIVVNISQPTFIQLLIGTYSYGALVVEPEGNYQVNIDLNSKKKSIKVTGTNEKGQELYGILSKRQISKAVRKFSNDSIVVKIKENIQSTKDYDIAKFKELLSDGDISESFYNLVRIDRECYYSVIQGKVALNKYFEYKRKQREEVSAEFKNMWDEVFLNTPIASPNLASSFWYYSLVENFLFYKEFTDESFDKNKIMGIYNQGLKHTHNINISKKHLNSSMLEYYQARYLHSASVSMKYEKELITIFEEFKKDFPNSEFSKFLAPMITPIAKYLKIADHPYPEKIKFINNYKEINSLKESVKIFEGKKVYVDVWASWCLPCRAEFKHRKELKNMLKAKDVEILYISIDSDRYENQWKEMIKFYNLEGTHIRANRKLDGDLRSIYNEKGSLTIPWYILIDENGNIIKEHANHPSQIKKLEKQIDGI